MIPPWIAIAGPTGTGKSELAVALAERLGGEIVNYDSVQIYRGFDIGSAKPDTALRSRLPHHLFDIVDADEEFSAADFARAAAAVCADIERRGRRPVLVGGTGFYLRALLAGLPEMPGRDEALRARLRRLLETNRGRERAHRWLERVDAESASRIAAADRHRLERALEVWILTGRPISSWRRPTGATPIRPACRIALSLPREELSARLDRRVAEMYAAGLVEETRALLARYPSSARPFGAIGYAEAAAVVRTDLDREAAIARTQRRTRNYAKRQMTWLRAERDMHWVDARTPPEERLEQALGIVGTCDGHS
ncbi:MAG: tRNA (adenosine(37)-N6)-dimethylallyltransferase MiaA [Thermoanaerobaculia bacterium]